MPKNAPTPEKQREIIDRILWELSTICGSGYESYFLIVWDFILWAREHDIAVGPGRGSAAGAVVSYAIKITNLDPLEHGLLFERFLNPDRVSMPDIDIDFQDDRRGEVIKYVEDKYGHENVAHTGTFGTMAARAAFKDVARAFDKPFTETNKHAQLIEVHQGKSSLAESIKSQPVKDLCEKEPEYKQIFEIALKLEGCIRQVGTHACAMVVSDIPLVERGVPLARLPRGGEGSQTQYDMHAVEDMGMLKVDFLGLRNLGVVHGACALILQRHGKKIDIDNLPTDDPEAYKIFADGHTVAIFQFESAGMRRFLKQLKPTEFEHITAMAALYRPGPLGAGFVEKFIARKNGKEKVEFDHPDMTEILGPTYGVTVYQEQVMQLSRKLAGFTGGQADILRKAIGKKNAELLAKMEVEFIDGCAKNGHPKKLAEKIWEDWKGFAAYAFNKSHSACYAYIGYQTAWLKAHYPIEFACALLNADRDNPDRLVIDMTEAKRLEIQVLPPSVRESGALFTIIDDDKIRFGLKGIKGLGDGAVDEILLARKK